MMCDRRDVRLGDELAHCQTEGNVHWDCECVLNDKKIDVEGSQELVQVLLQMEADGLDKPGSFRRAGNVVEEIAVNSFYVGVLKVRFRDDDGGILRAIRLAAEVKALVAHLFKNCSPLLSLEGDAICA